MPGRFYIANRTDYPNDCSSSGMSDGCLWLVYRRLRLPWIQRICLQSKPLYNWMGFGTREKMDKDRVSREQFVIAANSITRQPVLTTRLPRPSPEKRRCGKLRPTFWAYGRPTGSNPFHPSLGPLAAILRLLPRRVQFPIPGLFNSRWILLLGDHIVFKLIRGLILRSAVIRFVQFA